MIAPDYFAPFRRFAEQYHVKAEGLAAAAALDRLLAFGEADMRPPLAEQTLDWPQRGLVAITGPSGAGKTTLLRRLAGVDSDERGPAIDWISTDAFVPQGTLADAIGWNAVNPDRAAVHAAAASVGLLDDALLPGGLDAPPGSGGENLSGGQRLRLAIARAALSDNPVAADEPTAKLDAANAGLVRAALQRFAATRPVIVATHDEALAALADRRIALAPREARP